MKLFFLETTFIKIIIITMIGFLPLVTSGWCYFYYNNNNNDNDNNNNNNNNNRRLITARPPGGTGRPAVPPAV